MSADKRDFDAAASTWDENLARVKMAQDVAQAIIDLVKPKKESDVLDFGAGTGLLSLALRPHVHSVVAADSSQGMLDVLNDKIKKGSITNVRTMHIDLEKGDRLEGQYDLVVSSMTCHHIKDIDLLLKHLVHVLKPGGQIAIADLDCDEGKFHDIPDGVFHNGFDRCIMKKHLESAGFGSIRNRTAAIMLKPGPSGETRTFTIFLMAGKKSE